MRSSRLSNGTAEHRMAMFNIEQTPCDGSKHKRYRRSALRQTKRCVDSTEYPSPVMANASARLRAL
jgi:hypothetical protein